MTPERWLKLVGFFCFVVVLDKGVRLALALVVGLVGCYQPAADTQVVAQVVVHIKHGPCDVILNEGVRVIGDWMHRTHLSFFGPRREGVIHECTWESPEELGCPTMEDWWGEGWRFKQRTTTINGDGLFEIECRYRNP